MPRSRSWSIESITRSDTSSCAAKTPDWRSIASTSVVLPWSTCAMIATLRMSVRVAMRAPQHRASVSRAGSPGHQPQTYGRQNRHRGPHPRREAGPRPAPPAPSRRGMAGRPPPAPPPGGGGRPPGPPPLPLFKLVAIGEIALLAHTHVQKLEPAERRRLVELLRAGRGRRSNLSAADRDELERLVAKAEPRLFAGLAADRLSPVPLPRRLVRGRRRH